MNNINWKYEIGERIIDYNKDGSIKRDLTIIDRKIIKEEKTNYINGNKFNANKKYYKYSCNLCNFNCGKYYDLKLKKYKDEYWISESGIFGKHGCACCCKSPLIVLENINSIYYTDGWMTSIINDDEFCKTHTHSCSDKIYPICPNCKEKQSKLVSIDKIYSTKGVSCEYCSDNIKYPNKFMANVLQQLNINFEREYSPKWVEGKFYDFYIPSMDLIIEMDGGLGHGKEIHKLSKQTKEESKAIDDYKDEQAILHGIEVIRIDCDYGNKLNKRFEYIKQNILCSKLSQLFNLKVVDWNKCDTYGCNSLIKIACDLKNKNPYMTTSEACKVLNVKSSQTISGWWKIGNEYKWCHYDIQEEIRRLSSKSGMKNGQSVKVFKGNKYLAEFYSLSELERESLKLFGEKLIARYVGKSLKSQKTYKGYSFK